MKSKVNDYQLRQGDKVYIFSTCIVENGVRLSCKNSSGKLYSRDFTVLDINAIDPIFNVIKSENEAIKFIDKALNVHKVGVTEDCGTIKIIFYVTTKGIIHTIEIPLGEVRNTELFDNFIPSSSKIERENQLLEVIPQTFESNNYYNEKINQLNDYGLQSLYNKSNTIPLTSEPISETNFKAGDIFPQHQTEGEAETYNNSYKFRGENIESIGSFILQDDNQNSQINYKKTFSSTGFEGINSLTDKYPGELIIGNDYNDKSNKINHYTTSLNNNYITSNYENTDQSTQTTYNYNILNVLPKYSDNTHQYSQPLLESTTDYIHYSYKEYENTTHVKPLNYNILSKNIQTKPFKAYNLATQLSPHIATNNFKDNNFIQSSIGANQYKTQTSLLINSSLHLPLKQVYDLKYQINASLEDDNQYNQNIYSTQYIPDTTNNNSSDYNKFFQQTALSQPEITTGQIAAKHSTNNVEILNLQRENILSKIYIDELELQKLKSQAAEAASLKAQLVELEPLKKQVEEMAVLKNKILELDSLRLKVAELNSVKAQLEELNNLRQQVSQMNNLKKQLEELNSLRAKAADIDNLKIKIEDLEKKKLEYENEIKELKKAETKKLKDEIEAKEFDGKQKTFEGKTDQICVKGDIIHDINELEMITRKINKLNKNLTLNLLYKATADSDKAAAFHEKCDDAQSTIVLIETDKGKRFGGYTSCNWRGDCIDKKDEEAFIFSLDKMKIYDNIPGEDAVGCYPKFGPIFLGCQIRIYDNAFNKGGTTFEKGLNYNTEEDFELTGGERVFNVKEIEVYEVIPQ